MTPFKSIFLLVLAMLMAGLSHAQNSGFDFDKAKADAIKSGLLIEVDDSAVEEALSIYDQKGAEITKSCPQPTEGANMQVFMAAVSQCTCTHLPELVPVLQAKIDAFSDLLKRRPELANKTVTVKGHFGNFIMDPNEVNSNAAEELKKQFNCQ